MITRKQIISAILLFIVSLIITTIIVLLGALERGYFWPASEIFILPILWGLFGYFVFK